MSVLSSATNWLVKTGLEAAFGGDSKGSGGGGGGSAALAKATQQTQEQLASISAKQTMQLYNAEKNKIKSAATAAARPPQQAPQARKSSLGLQLIQKAKQNHVSDPIMMQLVEKQATRTGNVTDEMVASIKSSYASSALDSATRVRKTARGSFLNTG